MRINLEKFYEHLENERISRFDSLQEVLDYVNYNCPEIEQKMTSKQDLERYFEEYFLTHNNAYYLICYDEALDIYGQGGEQS